MDAHLLQTLRYKLQKRLKRINAWVHREYMRLFERCLAQSWPQWTKWSAATRDRVLRSVVTFINGITASAVASRADWPPQRQIEQLRLQLELLHRWALESARQLPQDGARSRRQSRRGEMRNGFQPER